MSHFLPTGFLLRLARASQPALILLLVTVLGAAEPKFTASLDRETIGMGETATLSLAFEGVSPGGAPQLPAIPGIEVQSVGQSSQFNLINGQATTTVTFSYTIAPTREGEINIPAFTIAVGGKPFSTQALKLKVLKAGDTAPDESGAGKAAFVRLIVPKTELYVGEVFPVEFQIFFQDAQDLQQPTLRTDGFTIVKQPPHSNTKAQLNGMVYNVISFKLSLVAAKTGAVKLGPFETKLSLRLVKRGQPQRDPFDPFGFFNRVPVELRPVTLVSEAPVLNILPLPTNGVPPGFSGSVGSYTMQLSASPTNLAVGDPITLRVRVEGRGTLDSIALPAFDAWREFKAYPPASKVESDDPLGIAGAKTFELVVTPQNAEVKELPALTFSYFDPELKSYRTLTQPPVKLAVRSSAPQQQPTVLAGTGAENTVPSRDIVHIKLRPGKLAPPQPPLIQQPWFVGLQAVPLLAWSGVLIWRRRKEQLANNPRLVRRRQVDELVRKGCQELGRLASGNQTADFYSTAFRLLQEQIAERLGQPASGITDEAVNQLSSLGADEQTRQTLHELFGACNEARYAPHSTAQQLAGLVPQIEKALLAVRNLGGER